MKKKLFKKIKELFEITGLLICLSAGLLTTTVISCVSTYSCSKKLENYKQYYEATERLLDSLEEEFNWIDRYDSPILDDYYATRSKINK